MSQELVSPEPTDAPKPSDEQKDESMDRLSDVNLRVEEQADYEKVETLLDEAFGADKHVGELVRLIRQSPNHIPQFSIVAEKKGEIVGHVMLSYVELEDGDDTHRVLTLSPLAVAPSEQRTGIGGKLIADAVQIADNAGEQLIVLEGSPKYYPRFGFRPASEVGVEIELPAWAPPEAAMAMPLTNYDPALRGKVKYPPAFDVTHD